jgi:predicted transcriptional regulator YdeE
MEFVERHAFDVIGIETRTSFRKEKDGAGLIGALWTRFMGNGLEPAIPNRTGRETIALYTDYESDEYGEYTLVLGARVASIAEVPHGMVTKHVPAARYAVFPTDPGDDVAHRVINAWKRIWNEPRTAEYTRAYRADFEVYGANGSIDINVGVGVVGVSKP